MEIAMDMAQTFLNAENGRVLLLLVAMLGGFTWLKSSFKMDILRLDHRIDKLDSKIDAKFSELDAKMDFEIGKLDAKMGARIDKLDSKMDAKFSELDAKMDFEIGKLDAKMGAENSKVYAKFGELKNNDFKHLIDAIETLTYVLEKNGQLTPKDKAFVDSKLDKPAPLQVKTESDGEKPSQPF